MRPAILAPPPVPEEMTTSSPRWTASQALSLAGGFLPFAKRDKVAIVRDLNGVQTRIPINYEKLEKGKNLQQLNVLLQGGDTIVVP